MRFYPDIYPVEGHSTRIPNLLIMLTMGRSWAAWGAAADDVAEGLELCRRAIRLGRLLRQDDVILINDLVGLACIHLETRGIYRLAVRSGDLELALTASAVLGEVAPQRLFTAQRVSTIDFSSTLAPFLSRTGDGPYSLSLHERKLDEIIELATTSPDRRFRVEGLLYANAIAMLGTDPQKQRVAGLFQETTTSDDYILASFARWCLDHEPSPETLEQLLPSGST